MSSSCAAQFVTRNATQEAEQGKAEAHAALLVEQVEDARLALFALDEVDARLVVEEVDERPCDLLLHVLLLLQLEHVLHAHATHRARPNERSLTHTCNHFYCSREQFTPDKIVAAVSHSRS